MNNPATVASGVLTLASLAATVKCHMGHRRAKRDGEEESKKKKKKCMKVGFMVATLLFACVFVYQLMQAKPAGSFLPSSSMSHTESEAEFARRVQQATAKLREKMQSQTPHAPLTAPYIHASAPQSTNELAARASAEISSFIANNV